MCAIRLETTPDWLLVNLQAIKGLPYRRAGQAWSYAAASHLRLQQAAQHVREQVPVWGTYDPVELKEVYKWWMSLS
jgi:hypothetical protein